MSARAKLATVVPPSDPAGFDRLLFALAKGATEFAERKALEHGVPLKLWDGKDGLGMVVEQIISDAGIPNKRFPELVSPRSIAEHVGIVKRSKRRLK